MKYMIGVDVGGTFTDLTLVNVGDKTIKNHKVYSTPDDPSVAIMTGIKEIAEMYDVPLQSIDYLAHGTTVATNALIERKGADTGLLVTKGFRDLLEIGDQTRPNLYDLFKRKPEPFVKGYLREEVEERLYADGSVHQELNREALLESISSLKDEGVEAVAVCLLFSYINPKHEKEIVNTLKEHFPEAYVSASHEIVPEFREYSRLSTTVLNAYLGPVIKRYMERFRDKVQTNGIKVDPYITQSNGGIISIQESVSQPIRTAVSGPAAGVVAAQNLGELTGYKNMITFDVGGTSADVSLIDNGTPQISTGREIEGFPAQIPMLDIVTIGAGGGSIAWIDEGGALKVGPESAGSKPGPACYGRGGKRPTVTDAHAVLGRINPNHLLGGRMDLDISAAEEAINEHICQKSNIDRERAAEGILNVVNANMARAIRLVSVEKGYDPREFTLVSFGGAGGLHAASVAKAMNIPRVLVPPASGTYCSMGLLVADVRSDYVRTYPIQPNEENKCDILTLFEEMKSEGEALLIKEQVSEDKRKYIYGIDARYVGQNYELTVTFSEDQLLDLDVLKELFHKEHEKVYSYSKQDADIEFVNYRLTAVGEQPKAPVRYVESEPREKVPVKSYRNVSFSDGYVKTPIYSRDDLRPGDKLLGPAIIEQMDSTTVILPDQTMTVDHYLNLLIRNGKESL
ncbi:hydantoinase/oxoprolinase family protein [Scopulibacillus cellulosilyticus]|uniref:Hydantoinase/oxoprolinase family protein n=1 Tax=Scopulibacillus cellulosilyticus TaxID=2665665 RepID=A0ABW2Q1E5_9BACL